MDGLLDEWMIGGVGRVPTIYHAMHCYALLCYAELSITLLCYAELPTLSLRYTALHCAAPRCNTINQTMKPAIP